MSTVNAPGAGTLEVVRARDHHLVVYGLPTMHQGSQTVDLAQSDVAGRYFAQGTRHVTIDAVVDLADPVDEWRVVRTLVLVRDLTSYAIAVDWRLRLGGPLGCWPLLSHLAAPTELLNPDGSEILDTWRRLHFIDKCVFRRGPGFVQVRDRRRQRLDRFTIDTPEYLAAMDRLIDGAPISHVPHTILTEFISEGLVQQVGEIAWWLPYRLRRWPIPSMTI